MIRKPTKYKPFNYRFAVFCGLSAALGVIISALFYAVSPLIVLILPLALATLAAVGFTVAESRAILIHTLIFIIIYFATAIPVSAHINAAKSLDSIQEPVTVCGRVRETVSYSVEKDISSVIIEDVTADDRKISGVFVLCYVEGRAEIGDETEVYGTLDKTAYPDIDTFYFPSRVAFEITGDFGKITERGGGLFYEARRYIRNTLTERLDKSAYPFAVGIVLGEADELNAKTLQNLRAAGISHIFAVSGLHIGFLAALIAFLLRLINVRRVKNAILVFIITLIYSGICGFSVSAIRAAITCFIYGMARSFGLKRDGLNAVFVSMTAVLLVFPDSLFSLGFMLSFAAVTGISLFAHNLKEVFSFMPEKLGFALAVTVSAFLSTAPIIAIVGKNLSLIAIVCNLLALPFVSALYYLSIITLILNAVFSGLSVLFVPLNAVTVFLTDALSKVDFSRFLIKGSVTPFIAVFYYLTIILTSDKINLTKTAKRICACASSLSVLMFV